MATIQSPQFTFYNAGTPDTGETILGRVARDAINAFGLATGYFHDEQVLAGYRFLVEHHRAGDEVFGFGRGRTRPEPLRNIIDTIGLLPPEQIINSAPLVIWLLTKNSVMKLNFRMRANRLLNLRASWTQKELRGIRSASGILLPL